MIALIIYSLILLMLGWKLHSYRSEITTVDIVAATLTWAGLVGIIVAGVIAVTLVLLDAIKPYL